MIIYKVTNIINGKIYIGQSINSLSLRKTTHKHSALKNNSQSYFHKAIRKYGWDSFEWEVIDDCNTKQELDIKEIEYITLFESHISTGKGYNLTKGGDFNPMNDPEIKERAVANIRKAMQNFTGENNVMANPIHKQTHYDAIQQLSTNPDWIEAKRIGDEKQKSTYEITFPDGHIEIITGLNEFCKIHNLSQSKMSSVVTGNRPHHKKFKCKLISQGCKPASDPYKNKRINH